MGIQRTLFMTAIVAVVGINYQPPINVRPTLRHHGPMNLHRRRNQTQVESTNWSGYAVTTATGSTFTNVNGSWIVPTANCSSSGVQTAASSFWIGIDGFNSSTVEQIGTDSDCDSTANRRG